MNSFFSRSAAKARQALMSSEVSSEKSSKISTSVMPPAKYSKTSYTVPHPSDTRLAATFSRFNRDDVVVVHKSAIDKNTYLYS